MALEGTHIRIAVEVADLLGIKDEGSFIIGTIYPDSRYLTKIDRVKTHMKEYSFNDVDDFHKGWYVHLICDDIQYNLLHKEFSEILSIDDPEWWEKLTALKIIQDIEVVNSFDIQKYLKYLEKAINPNHEDIELIRRYNNIMYKMYADKKLITAEDAYNMWLDLGVDTKKGDRVKGITYEMLNNIELIIKLKDLYNEILIRVRKELILTIDI